MSKKNGITKALEAECGADITVDEGEVAALAYRLWLARGCPVGSPEEDWFLAERELRRTDAMNVTTEECVAG